MSTTKLGERPAFPLAPQPTTENAEWDGTGVWERGMSTRTWLAGILANGLLSNPHTAERFLSDRDRTTESIRRDVIRLAMEAADALLAGLEKP